MEGGGQPLEFNEQTPPDSASAQVPSLPQFNTSPPFARAHIAQARAQALKVQASAFFTGKISPHPRDHLLELLPIPTAFMYCSV